LYNDGFDAEYEQLLIYVALVNKDDEISYKDKSIRKNEVKLLHHPHHPIQRSMFLKLRSSYFQPKEATIEHLKEFIVDYAGYPWYSHARIREMLYPEGVDSIF